MGVTPAERVVINYTRLEFPIWKPGLDVGKNATVLEMRNRGPQDETGVDITRVEDTMSGRRLEAANATVNDNTTGDLSLKPAKTS
jgi:hypothetical protein